jgi:hypothetical protein
MKAPLVCGLLVLVSAGVAEAGGKEGTVGVGAEAGITNDLGGFSLNYDAGKFHVGGFVGFSNGSGDNDADYNLGGRFFYHVHTTVTTDLGLGLNLGLNSIDGQGLMNDERDTFMVIEPALQIRAFVTNNVALSFTAGISFAITDPNTSIILNGQINALAGVHYYFFK